MVKEVEIDANPDAYSDAGTKDAPETFERACSIGGVKNRRFAGTPGGSVLRPSSSVGGFGD